MSRFIFAVCLLFLATACGFKKPNGVSTSDNSPMKIIFETDMGNDVDDALAMDMLFKYAEDGKIDLIGISSNKSEEGSVEYIDLLTTWYGMPEIPIGKVDGGASGGGLPNYALATVNLKDSTGQSLFKRSHAADSHIMPSVEMYRKLLSEQQDSSVTIVSVGFSTNLARLLDSKADNYSQLDGRDLVAKKVRRLVTMAGDFEKNEEADSITRHKEYNIVKDIDAARKVFDEWPGKIVTSPFEIGLDILYPASSIENDFAWIEAHPVVEAYKSYMTMPYDRPTWDLTSVLYAVEGPDGYFSLSAPGKIEIDKYGGTRFIPMEGGLHSYLMTNSIQKKNILSRFLDIIPRKPKNIQ